MFAESTHRTAAHLLLLFLVSGAVSSVRAATGGPDTFGYTWRDSEEPGFDYLWFDPGVTATDVTVFGDDTTTGFLPLSFNFPYYGGSYSQVAVCSNGWVSLVDGTSTSYTNGALPNGAAPVGTIAAFWDDLRLTDGISRVLTNDLGDRFVVTWRQAHDLGDEAAINTFQVILHQDGRIVVQYERLLGELTSCTLGIESPDETDGLTAWFDDPVGVPSAAYAVEFSPPVPVSNDLDCAAATPVACSEWITGDNGFGVANQDAYLCSRSDWSGREQLYTLDVPVATDLRILLESTGGGSPGLLVLDGCDANRCVTAPSNSVTLTGVSGTFTLVVDSAPGEEGPYRLRVECLSSPADLDCAAATPLTCPDSVMGDLTGGAANQHWYWCTESDFSGAEDVYLLDLVSPATLLLELTALSGNPQMFVLDGCDQGACLAGPTDTVNLDDVSGMLYIVVDSAPGEEGAYQLDVTCLQDSFTFCGTGLYESDPWNQANGSWLVNGWFYHPGDTHNYALRVDGGAQTYTHDASCTEFPFVASGVVPPAGPGFVTWEAAEGRVDMTISETFSGGCCGLLVDIRVTNVDTVPHSYDFRVYHDTAFGTGDGTCTGGTVDGGPIRVRGTEYYDEVELLPLGADTCEGQVMMASAEDPAGLASSYEMLPPNLPTDMEFLDWNDGGQPCTDWQDLVDGESLGNCFDDSSLLLIWRFPNGAGTLAPGESASAQYRIGYQCAFPCNVACEDPVLAAGGAVDLGPCNDGIRLTWDAAVFPGGGNGVYHVRRSTVGFADARLQAPITAPAGLALPSFDDRTPPPNVPLYYVIEAESLDFPGCGAGTLVNGSTDEIELGPVTDDADVTGPMEIVGNTLRATGHTDTTVDFFWTTAPAPGPGESFRVFRADDDPQGPFVQVASIGVRNWTDPDAPPTFSPAHVWFYDVRLADECDNVSDD